MRRLALLLMVLSSFWIGAPLCAHAAPQPMPMPTQGTHAPAMASHHHHEGLATACSGCVAVAIVPDMPAVVGERRATFRPTSAMIRSLDGIGHAATAPPPRLRA